ncbi:MAG: Flp pilus assembly protein CpaB [Acidimicrobiia bacterium]
MDRKWIGVLISLVLAAVGTWVLVQYVNGADDRALEGVETVDVLVVSDTIPEGASIQDVSQSVERQSVPASAQAIGSVDTLSGLEGTVTAVALVPGEQVIASRFITPQQFAEAEAFEIPDELLAVTLSLSPERALGGELAPGDLIAVIASFEPFDINGVEPSEVDPDAEEDVEEDADELPKTPNSTGIIVHKAIVTNIQVEELPAETTAESAEAQGVEVAPTGNLLVTIATEAPYIEKMVFTAEFGTVWLAIEGELSAEEFDQVQTRNLIYREILTINDLVTR